MVLDIIMSHSSIMTLWKFDRGDLVKRGFSQLNGAANISLLTEWASGYVNYFTAA